MSKFKLTNGRIIDVDEDEIRNLVIAGMGEEIDDISQEEKSILANEMRNRAKQEFQQDQAAQKRSEYESKFESPLGKVVKNLFPYSTPYDQTPLEQSINIAKDGLSLPARLGKEMFGQTAEVLGTKLYSTDPKEESRLLSEIGDNFMDNVGNIKSQGIMSDIITDPMLPAMVAVNMIPGAGLLAGLGRFGAGTGSYVASEYAKPGDMSVEENAAPIITASVLNALPALKMIPFRGRTLANINQTRPVVQGAETVLRDVTNPSMKFVIASEKGNPTKATTAMLEDLWKTNSTLDRYTGNIAEKAGGLKGAALGAAIDPFVVPGSYYGGKYGAQLGSKLATPENISTLLRGLGTLQNTLGSDKVRYFAPVIDNTRQNLIRRD